MYNFLFFFFANIILITLVNWSQKKNWLWLFINSFEFLIGGNNNSGKF